MTRKLIVALVVVALVLGAVSVAFANTDGIQERSQDKGMYLGRGDRLGPDEREELRSQLEELRERMRAACEAGDTEKLAELKEEKARLFAGMHESARFGFAGGRHFRHGKGRTADNVRGE